MRKGLRKRRMGRQLGTPSVMGWSLKYQELTPCRAKRDVQLWRSCYRCPQGLGQYRNTDDKMPTVRRDDSATRAWPATCCRDSRNKCLLFHPTQKGLESSSGNNPSVYQMVNGETNCGISIQWYQSAINRNELLINATTRMNLKIIMLSKKKNKKTKS